MTYRFRNWKLYKTNIDMNNDIGRTLYFFSRWRPKQGIPCDLPEGYLVILNERTGLPYLQKDVKR